MRISSLVSSKPAAAGQCLTVRVTRTVKGAIDPALSQNGTFTADRYDYIEVVVMPSP